MARIVSFTHLRGAILCKLHGHSMHGHRKVLTNMNKGRLDLYKFQPPRLRLLLACTSPVCGRTLSRVSSCS